MQGDALSGCLHPWTLTNLFVIGRRHAAGRSAGFDRGKMLGFKLQGIAQSSYLQTGHVATGCFGT